MNLVKLQDDLKMLPMAALQSKAQGQDPQVPPWLATAVLNERMDAQKKAGMAQGAAQGEQPSIAEQLNQKAGLMALQGQQQQQAQQQMMQQMAQAPQPAPENVPQPEQQPEPQMMAQGGLARLPVDSRMFDYRAGGIIGFSGGDTVPPASGRWQDMTKRPDESNEEFARRVALARQASYQSQMAPTEEQLAAKRRAASEAERARNMAQVQQVDSMELPPRPAMTLSTPRVPGGLPAALPKAPPPPPVAAAAPRPRVAQPQQPAQQPPPQPPQPTSQPAGLASLPPAAPQQSPIEMAKAASEAFPMARKEPSLQGIIGVQEEARQAAGAKRAGEPEQEQLSAYQAETERLRKARAEANAMETLSGYGGLAGLGQRRAAIMQRDNLADTIRNDATEKMRLAMEGMKQAQAAGNVAAYNAEKEKYISAQDARANASITATNELAKQRMQSDTQMAGYGMQADTAAKQLKSEEERAKLLRDTQKEIANIQARATVLASQGRLDSNEGKLLYQAAEKMVDTARKELEDVMSNPMYKSEVPAKQKALADAKAALMIAAGGKMPAGVDTKVAPPPPGAVREVKK